VSDDRRAALEHARALLSDAVAEAALVLRNGAAELDAHGGFDDEATRLRTIAVLFDSCDDMVDAVRFCTPTVAAIAERVNEAAIAHALALDLRTTARVLLGRIARVEMAGG
jgi:hypothetical protein